MTQHYWSNGVATLFQSDAREIPLPDQSVHCVVTSPPYYGLRVYRSDSDAMIGLEATVQGWLDSMLAVMDEVWRVLRDDGTVWVNLGDSYGGSGGAHQNDKSPGLSKSFDRSGVHRKGDTTGQLLMIPARFALAMQDAGWILRSDVIWAKKSCMPESLSGTHWERCRVKVTDLANRTHETGHRDYSSHLSNTPSNEYTDCPGCPRCADTDGLVLRNGSWRCTSSHEHIFQFVKSMGYYSDGEAVKTAHKDGTAERFKYAFRSNREKNYGDGFNQSENPTLNPSGANRRNVWKDISPEPYGGEHYATFPPDLPRICIQASTSEAGVCADCGCQWARLVEQTEEYKAMLQSDGAWNDDKGKPESQVNRHKSDHPSQVPQKNKTLSWRPTCTCNADKVGATVLDCFAGTGTTLLAAMRLGRQSYGTDLSEDYLDQAVKRLSHQTLPMTL